MSDKQLHTLNATMTKQQSQVTCIPQSECICRLGLGFEQVIQCECELACKRIPSYALFTWCSVLRLLYEMQTAYLQLPQNIRSASIKDH